ncbi:MAG: D-alanyl-D-alanine carboxypeptidase/D-alanyl-D-alanine-endopeptidase [Chloroflexi bacterium]|nr:D-alanyl-D-alanine carboxypeptidase/D-alanyl-D-alanine-endopeptidase [Chloroflexota bacterium]
MNRLIRQPGRQGVVVNSVLGLVLLILLAGTNAAPGMALAGAAAPETPLGAVPPAAQAIMDKSDYRTARWLYDVVDLNSGQVLLANRADQLVFTGSTAKQFTVGSAYETLGIDRRATTPVYATAGTNNGLLSGNLVLVASGDLGLGGRNSLDGRFDFTFTADSVDHVYADVAPNGVEPPGDPLAGLDSLAQQVAAKGVARIDGDVIVDDRLWQTFEGQEGPVPPIFVNDNLLDITVTPAHVGQTATLTASPVTSAFRVTSQVETAAGADVALAVAADPADARHLVVSGTIGADAGPRLTVYRVPDAASWARTLFVEALARAGVRVAANPDAANPSEQLPPAGNYAPALELASIASAPLSAEGSMILQTSYNTGANALLCQLASNAGSTSCLDGLPVIRALTDQAGIPRSDLILVDGQGADPASVTPEQMVRWLTWTQSRPWADVFKAGQPVLGESGTLASAGVSSPARGKVQAKTGTSLHADPATGRALFNVQSMAGFLQTDDGRALAYDVSMSGGTYPDVLTGLVQATEDVADVSAQFQQALSRATPTQGNALPASIAAIMAQPRYARATWNLLVTDLQTGSTLYQLAPDQLAFTGSTRKLFSVGLTLRQLGADHRFTTPVYRNGTVDGGGTLHGNLELVGAGDLTLGGRLTPDGTIAYTDFDHNDANNLGTAILAPQDPLHGLDALAQQVRASGIEQVDGDVVVDDRLFDSYRVPNQDLLVSPIMVNENMVDVSVTPTQPGQHARLDYRPKSAAFSVRGSVDTLAAGGTPTVAIPRVLIQPDGSPITGLVTCVGTPDCSGTVSGAIPVGYRAPLSDEGTFVATFRIENPANYVRSAFVEALQHAGVAVSAPVVARNPTERLRSPDAYSSDVRVAQFISPPYADYARLILKVSLNLGANLSLTLFGLANDQRTLPGALSAERATLVDEFGIQGDTFNFPTNGSGSPDSQATARAEVQLLTQMSRSGVAQDFKRALPILGVDGSLAHSGTDLPARGHVFAKTGTTISDGELKAQVLAG